MLYFSSSIYFNLNASLHLKWVSWRKLIVDSSWSILTIFVFELEHLDHWQSDFWYSRINIYISYCFPFVSLLICSYFCLPLFFWLSWFYFAFCMILFSPFKAYLSYFFLTLVMNHLFLFAFFITRISFVNVPSSDMHMG